MMELSERSLKDSINKSRVNLVDNLNLENVIEKLIAENILTNQEYQDVRAKKTLYKKNRQLVDFLQLKGSDELMKFLSILVPNYPKMAEKIKLRASLLDCSTEIENIDDKTFRILLQNFLQCISENDPSKMPKNPKNKLEHLEEIVTQSEDNFIEFMHTLRETEMSIQETQPKLLELSGLAEKLGELSGLDEFITQNDELRLRGNSPVPTTTLKVTDKFTNIRYIRKKLYLFSLDHADEIIQEMLKVKARLQYRKENYIARISTRMPYPILISEYYPQNSLQQYLTEQKEPFDETTVREWIQWIASSLYSIYRYHPFHGNLKPSNIIILTERKSVRLIDFGVRSLLLHEHCRPFIAKCPYIAPEVKGGSDISSSSDVWSLGIIAYELLTRDANTTSYLFSNGFPHRSDDIKTLVSKMLQNDPASRPSVLDIIKLAVEDFPNAPLQSNFSVDTKVLLLYSQGYSNIELLGRGASGVVYKVNRKTKTLAAKVIDLLYPCSKGSDRNSRLAYHEAQTLAALNHANIVKFDKYFRKERYLAIITEFCKGGNLRNRFEKQKKECSNFDCDLSLRWANEMIDALEYIHNQKVLHRDFKPENIFLTEDDEIKVGDFGLATHLNNTCGVAITLLGTPEYMAPEVKKGKPYGMAADLWSLGVVLHEIFTLEKPNKIVIDATRSQMDSEHVMTNFVLGLLTKDPSRRQMFMENRKQHVKSRPEDQYADHLSRTVKQIPQRLTTERTPLTRDSITQASFPTMSHQLVTYETTEDKVQLNFCDVSAALLSTSRTVKHVTIMGKARAGKSFLLNAIAGQNSLFTVGNGPTVTKGVHISGDIFPLDTKNFVREIDIEGMGNTSQNYDYSLALPVLAASDLILFNFKGQPRGIDVIKELNLLVHIFSRVITNEENKKVVEEQTAKFLFPPIILVLRDWPHGAKYTPEMYLKEIFSSSDASLEEIHRCVKTIDVCFLPFPADQETLETHDELPLDEMSTRFSEALNQLKQQMVSYLREPTATFLQSGLSTTDFFLWTVKFICGQLNKLNDIQISEAIDATMTYAIDIAVETVIDYVENQCPTKLPMAKKELKKFLEHRNNAAIGRFRDATQHMKRAKQRTLISHEEKHLLHNIALQNREKELINDYLINELLYKEAESLLEKFDAYMNGIKTARTDLLAAKQKADQWRVTFVAGLVAVARKNNFLGVSAASTIDEKTARSLLPIDHHLKDFGFHADSKLKEHEIFLERQKATQNEAKLAQIQAELMKLTKTIQDVETEKANLMELMQLEGERANQNNPKIGKSVQTGKFTKSRKPIFRGPNGGLFYFSADNQRIYFDNDYINRGQVRQVSESEESDDEQ